MKTASIAPEYQVWSQEEFGHAELPERRLRNRLKLVAAGLAQSPGGTIPSTMRSGAERQGAYGLLSSERFSYEAIQDSSHRATMSRLQGQSIAFVPIDGSALK